MRKKHISSVQPSKNHCLYMCLLLCTNVLSGCTSFLSKYCKTIYTFMEFDAFVWCLFTIKEQFSNENRAEWSLIEKKNRYSFTHGINIWITPTTELTDENHYMDIISSCAIYMCCQQQPTMPSSPPTTETKLESPCQNYYCSNQLILGCQKPLEERGWE